MNAFKVIRDVSILVDTRARVALLLLAAKKSVLKGSLWNRVLTELAKSRIPVVCWWRTCAMGAFCLLASTLDADKFLVDPSNSQTSPATNTRPSNSSPAILASSRTEPGDGLHSRPVEHNALSRELVEAERTLGVALCELQFPTLAACDESNYTHNVHVLTIVQECTRWLSALSELRASYLIAPPGTHIAPCQSFSWAFTFTTSVLTQAKVLSLIAYRSFISSNICQIGNSSSARLRFLHFSLVLGLPCQSKISKIFAL